MKRILLTIAAIVAVFVAHAPGAEARVRIHIDLTSQRMSVDSSSGSYVWPVSTARSGYVTPRGAYAPQSLQRMHYSRKYHMSPMPYSIFFRGGYAIHGSYETGSLGRPASHGCVRLSPAHAAALYQMVQREGASISISGSPPRGQHYAAAHRGQLAARHRQAPMAYAPYRHWTPNPIQWQYNPYGR